MRSNQITAIFILLIFALVVAYDFLALVFGGAYATISVVLNEYFYFANPLMVFLVGFIVGGLVIHFFNWAPKDEQSHGT